jgi:hypothetical protein
VTAHPSLRSPDRVVAAALLLVVHLVAGPVVAQGGAIPPPPPAAAPGPAPGPTPPEPTTPAADPPPSPEQRFQRGKRTFEYRDCPATIALLADLAVPGLLADEAQQVEVHRMLGICYALGDQRRDASREFSSLLSLDPDHQLDPFEVPPPVMELFETQKQMMKSRLDELRRARERQKDDLVDGGVLVERVTTVKTTPLPAAFLPFGLSQWANGEATKGAIFASVQGAALLVNVVGYWGSVIVQTQGRADGYAQEEADLENIFYFAHLGALGTFFVAYGAGVADALWNREEQAVTASKATKRPLTPKELSNLRRIERAPDPAPEPIEGEPPPPASTPAP